MEHSPDQWERIQELFYAACELDQNARAEYLVNECGDDTDLRTQVEALLASEGDTTDLQSAVWRSLEDISGPQPGTRIGPYEVIRSIGQGGMGAVYLAVRADDNFRKQVAIKLLFAAFPSARMLARFRTERQIVADLEHPYIARLLDGGTTDNGAPYLVMEYVDGVPLDVFYRQRKLSLTEQLQLFRQICDAVSYAHRKLVVHRDIKPGNILVTADGTPKLVDFGIAKLLTLDGESPDSKTTGLLMTPEYASPEQIRNESITTATDVYALGVVLYEWLTGRRPYDVSRLSPGETERAICLTDPVRPSAAVGELSPATRRRLRGDLDNIVLRAMHKDPARRYASVERLDDDIRRYLEGLPVSARPDTWRYRSEKFVRRHVYSVSAAAVLVVMLIAFSTGMAVLASRLARQRDIATEQAERTEQISQFLLNLFKVSDPSEARGNSITAREILDRGAQRISVDLRRQPTVQAALLETMGNVYEGLGLYARAQALFEQSLSVRRGDKAIADVDIAQSELDIARELEIRDTDYPAGEAMARKALAIRRARFGENSLPVADCLEVLGNLARSEGNSAEAERQLKQAYLLNRNLSGEGSLATAQAAYDLGRVMWDKGDTAGAGNLFQQVYAIRQKVLPADDPSLLDGMEAVAFVWQAEGKLSGAEDYMTRVLGGRRKIYGPFHYGVSTALDNLASVLQDEGKLREAEATYREAIVVERKSIGEWSRSTAITLNNLAGLLRDRGDYPEAESTFREAIAVYRKTIGSDHSETAFCLNNLAGTLLLDHKLAQAKQAADEALAIQRKRLNADSPAIARTLRTLGRIREAQHDRAGAISAYQQALDVIQKNSQKNSSQNAAFQASILLPYGTLLNEMNKGSQAEPLLRNAFQIQVNLHGADAVQTAEAEEELGMCLAGLRQYPEAETCLRHAYEVFRKTRGDGDLKTRSASKQLVTYSALLKKP